MLEDKAQRHDKLVKVLGREEADRLISLPARSDRNHSNEMVV